MNYNSSIGILQVFFYIYWKILSIFENVAKYCGQTCAKYNFNGVFNKKSILSKL